MTKFIDFHTHSQEKQPDIYQIYNLDLDKNISNQLNVVDAFVVGIHPWSIEAIKVQQKLDALKSLLSNREFLGIGECGLDRSIDIDYNLQKEVFLKQLIIARDNDIQFVVVHCVRAYNDILSIYNESKLKCPLVFHDYNGNESITNDLIKRGFYFSLGKKGLIDKKRKSYRSLDFIPITNIFFETDDSIELIKDVYIEYGVLKSISVEDLKLQVWQNLITLLK